jgi:hypothetical protein
MGGYGFNPNNGELGQNIDSQINQIKCEIKELIQASDFGDSGCSQEIDFTYGLIRFKLNLIKTITYTECSIVDIESMSISSSLIIRVPGRVKKLWKSNNYQDKDWEKGDRFEIFSRDTYIIRRLEKLFLTLKQLYEKLL